jgi:chemosensory pili system protein ChpA (sensor histidine kinase/response regulator)
MTGDTGIQENLIGGEGGGATMSALSIVSDELMETIRSAHLALEDCVDGRGGSAALVRAAELLHQARGALQLTETYGAALLTEEMELGCKFLAGLRAGKGRVDGLDALTRAMVQLPVYIERLLGGGRDIALVLLPMLNDLRAARGEPLLSEGTLLLLNLSPSQVKRKSEKREGSGEDPVAVATRLRPKFQLALLGWIKGGDTTRHLETLTSVTRKLEQAATRDDMYQLYWVAGGVLESLQDGGLETSVAIKRLLGQTDRQIKRVIDEGIVAFDNHPIDDLLNNLLYYVARSSTAGERIGEIRAAFNLAELLPGDEQVEHAREALSAPSVKLMETVAAAIKEDLARVKDVLDIFVRTGMNKSAELVPQPCVAWARGVVISTVTSTDSRQSSNVVVSPQTRLFSILHRRCCALRTGSISNSYDSSCQQKQDQAVRRLSCRHRKPPTIRRSPNQSCASALSTWRGSRRRLVRAWLPRHHRKVSTVFPRLCVVSKPD